MPTRLIKIVVTDDRGRYVLPDLPKGTYNVWVRGYGLVDSPKVKAAPGKPLNLTATVAPGPKAAAEYYPAAYWFSLIQVPGKNEFPGTGAKGNGKACARTVEFVDVLPATPTGKVLKRELRAKYWAGAGRGVN